MIQTIFLFATTWPKVCCTRILVAVCDRTFNDTESRNSLSNEFGQRPLLLSAYNNPPEADML